MNDDKYILNLDRLHICDLMLACTHIIWDAKDEMANDPNCPEYRREHVLPGTIKKWQDLHDLLEKQLDKQDRLQDWYTA